MYEQFFYWSGVITWVFLVATVVPAVPALVWLTLTWPVYNLATWLDGRYFEGPESVKTSKEEGRWYYYVTHYLFSLRNWMLRSVALYCHYMEYYYRVVQTPTWVLRR